VCCVRPAADGHVLTASWDGTAKLWSAASSKCVATITNPSTAKHELSFTAVLEHSQTKTILTASADRTIRRWSSDGTEVQVYAGHGGVIRGICWLSPTRFASCGAGGEIKVWDLDGSCLRTVNGHGGKMVYSIVGFEDGVGAGFATAGGDGCVWIWRDGECKQQLQLPCDAALMVDAAPNGDLVVACPDGTARVFSSEPDRQLPAPEIRTYKEMVTAALVKMEEAAAEGGGGSAGGMVGDLDTENLKGPEALEQPGKENGQILMVKKGGKVEAHEWSEASGSWTLIGIVHDAQDEKPPPGWQYFDIKLDGKTMRLKHEVGTNPYMSAQTFIHTNDLEQFYLDEVAKFVIDNSEAPALGGPVAGNVDPFTGGSAYVAGSNSGYVPTGPVRSRDPLTGGSAYVPDYAQARAAPAHAQSAAPAPAPAAAQPAIFPVTQYVTFKAIKVAGLLRKVDEFNTAVPAPSQLDAAGLAEVHLQLEAVTTEGVDVEPGLIGPNLLKLLAWPPAQRFPGVDALRVALLRPTLRAALLDEVGGAELLAACFEMAGIAAAGQASTCPGPAEMLAMRCLANSFDDGGRMLKAGLPAKIVAGLGNGGKVGQLNKGQLLAATTVLLNLAVLIAKQDAAAVTTLADVRNKSLRVLASILEAPACKADAEIGYRALLAAGTLVHASGINFTAAAAAALGVGVAGFVGNIARLKGSPDARAAAAAAAIQKLVV